jgi:DNA-directed RNA polymerase subunit RPC12/RpoP
MNDISVCADCGWIGHDFDLHTQIPTFEGLSAFIKQAIASNNLEFRMCPACGSTKILYKKVRTDPNIVMPVSIDQQPINIPSCWEIPQSAQEDSIKSAEQDIDPELDMDVVEDILATASSPQEEVSILDSLGINEDQAFKNLSPEDKARKEQELKVMKRRAKQEARKRELEQKDKKEAAKNKESIPPLKAKEGRPPPTYFKYTCFACNKDFKSKVRVPDARNNGARCPKCIKALI